ncbi:HNH endonuclease [Dysosmobacter sp.]|uniref:HNH endonuclease n=1 Tax=Dysosmobacter sp. TaxID=2591382 RepID=UPI003FA44D90
MVPDHNGLLLRPAHHHAFDQRLSADAGAEGAGFVFFCHGISFLAFQVYHSVL